MRRKTSINGTSYVYEFANGSYYYEFHNAPSFSGLDRSLRAMLYN